MEKARRLYIYIKSAFFRLLAGHAGEMDDRTMAAIGKETGKSVKCAIEQAMSSPLVDVERDAGRAFSSFKSGLNEVE